MVAEPSYSKTKISVARRIVRQLPCARPDVRDTSSFLKHLKDRPNLEFQAAPQEIIGYLQKPKRSGIQRRIAVVNPYVYFFNVLTFGDVTDALKVRKYAFGHWPYLRRRPGEHNSKAEQLREYLSEYGGNDYPSFCNLLAEELGGLSPEVKVLRCDIQNFYPSTPHGSFLAQIPFSPERELKFHDRVSVLSQTPGIGIIVDLIGAHASVLSGFVLTELDDQLEAYVRSGTGRYLRYLDDIILMGDEDVVSEMQEVVSEVLARHGLQLNAGKTLLQMPGDTFNDFGFDVMPYLQANDLEFAASLLRRSAETPSSRRDACDKWLILASSFKSSIGPLATARIESCMESTEFLQSLSARQWTGLLVCISKGFVSGRILLNTLDHMSVESSYTWACLINATHGWLRSHPAIMQSYEIAVAKGSLYEVEELVRYVPPMPILN